MTHRPDQPPFAASLWVEGDPRTEAARAALARAQDALERAAYELERVALARGHGHPRERKAQHLAAVCASAAKQLELYR